MLDTTVSPSETNAFSNILRILAVLQMIDATLPFPTDFLLTGIQNH